MRTGSRVRLRLASDERLVACVRDGDAAAFEALYERHSRGLLSFCAYMLGSRQDAEDALQATYASAYRALLADSRPVNLRPWLFTIARNECLNILRRRRPTVELNGEPALTGDPVRHAEVHEELRQMVEGVRKLPEAQRAALVLAEVHGLTQSEIGSVLGVRSEQVKAYIFQARSNLISDRVAHETDCREIREEFATARGASLLRGRLRRHLRTCAGCREYADGVSHQHRQLALLPLVPTLALRTRVIEQTLGLGYVDSAGYAGGAVVGASMAGELAGGGLKALVAKVAVGVAALGASAGVSAAVLNAPLVSSGTGTPASNSHHAAALLASVGRAGSAGREEGEGESETEGAAGSGAAAAAARGGAYAGSSADPALPVIQSGGGADPAAGAGTDVSGEIPGKGVPTPADPTTPGAQQPATHPPKTATPHDGAEEAALARAKLKREREERAQTRAEAEHKPQPVSPPIVSPPIVLKGEEGHKNKPEEPKSGGGSGKSGGGGGSGKSGGGSGKPGGGSGAPKGKKHHGHEHKPSGGSGAPKHKKKHKHERAAQPQAE